MKGILFFLDKSADVSEVEEEEDEELVPPRRNRYKSKYCLCLCCLLIFVPIKVGILKLAKHHLQI